MARDFFPCPWGYFLPVLQKIKNNNNKLRKTKNTYLRKWIAFWTKEKVNKEESTGHKHGDRGCIMKYPGQMTLPWERVIWAILQGSEGGSKDPRQRAWRQQRTSAHTNQVWEKQPRAGELCRAIASRLLDSVLGACSRPPETASLPARPQKAPHASTRPSPWSGTYIWPPTGFGPLILAPGPKLLPELQRWVSSSRCGAMGLEELEVGLGSTRGPCSADPAEGGKGRHELWVPRGPVSPAEEAGLAAQAAQGNGWPGLAMPCRLMQNLGFSLRQMGATAVWGREIKQLL